MLTNLKSSFFDDAQNEATEDIWCKNEIQESFIPLSRVKLIESPLYKPSRSNILNLKTRYFVLYEDRLLYYKNPNDTKPKAHIFLNGYRIEQIIPKDKNSNRIGFRIISNKKCEELYCKTVDLLEKWISKLRKTCVFKDFSSHYKCIKAIGKGSFAKVYLLQRISDGSEMAVKSFDKRQLVQSAKNKLSLINEINIMKKMDHDGIIKLYEIYESDNHINLILELLKGGELFDRIIKKGHYTESDACALMIKLLGALNFMHQSGIMHRDIKPENLILKSQDDDTDIKLADFGLSTYVNAPTQLFKRCGTPGYVAPEVLDDQPYDQKVDVFSSGVILYILLTGSSPFYGKTYNEILLKNKKCDIKFNFEGEKHKPTELAVDLLKKMLMKNPAQRVSAAEALNHPWILYSGITSPGGIPRYLNSAQENMKRFQEENRFNVSRIKPKDIGIQMNSPVITGRTSTIDESNSQSLINSPSIKPVVPRREVDMRKMAILQNAKKAGEATDIQDSDILDESENTPQLRAGMGLASKNKLSSPGSQNSPKTIGYTQEKRQLGQLSNFGPKASAQDNSDTGKNVAKNVRNLLKNLE